MALKRKMTFDEMARHMEEHTYRIANRVNVGMYARSLGYHTYKPMIAGKMQFSLFAATPPSSEHGGAVRRG